VEEAAVVAIITVVIRRSSKLHKDAWQKAKHALRTA
jgi:hypothetical protein